MPSNAGTLDMNSAKTQPASSKKPGRENPHGVPLLITIPAVLVGVGDYVLLDSFGAFDGIKEYFGANSDFILKKE